MYNLVGFGSGEAALETLFVPRYQRTALVARHKKE
jgi:hypothetical protein